MELFSSLFDHLLEIFPIVFNFHIQPFSFERPLDCSYHCIELERLSQEIVRPPLHRINAHTHVIHAGDNQKCRARLLLADNFQEVQAGHRRHAQIGNNGVEGLLFHQARRFLGARTGSALEPFMGEPFAEHLANTSLIIDYQDRRIHCQPPEDLMSPSAKMALKLKI